MLSFSMEILAEKDQSDTKRQDIAWEDECKVDDCTIKIQAVSKSGMLPEDDSEVFIIQDGKEIKIPHKPAYFHVISVLSDETNLASELPVFKIGKGQILIILSPDNRPSYAETSFVLYDYQNKKVLDVKERVASYKELYRRENYVLLSQGQNAYKIRLVKEWLELSDGPESAIEAWMMIKAAGGKLKYGWIN
jgi:hypothetical protein